MGRALLSNLRAGILIFIQLVNGPQEFCRDAPSRILVLVPPCVLSPMMTLRFPTTIIATSRHIYILCTPDHLGHLIVSLLLLPIVVGDNTIFAAEAYDLPIS